MTELTLDGRFLVRGNELKFCQSSNSCSSDDDVDDDESTFHPLWISDVSLSFWGGVDPNTGKVVDTTHPWYDRCVTGAILCMPSGRGSCTASQVLLELILNEMAPKAILLRDTDGLICVGAIIAQEIFQIANNAVPDILVLGNTQFQNLMTQLQQHPTKPTTISEEDNKAEANESLLYRARVLPNGQIQIIIDNNDTSTSLLLLDTQSTTGKATEMAELENKNKNNNNSALLSSTFSRREERMLHQCKSEAERMALRVIFRYAKILTQNHRHHWDATTTTSTQDPSSSTSTIQKTSLTTTTAACYYLTISQAHIDGCTYIGPGGLEFVQRLVAFGGRVRVPTTLNSVSVDRQNWQRLGVPRTHAIDAIALGDAYLELGCQPSFTCAPYLLQSKPVLGQDICWGESNAVVYANSVLGARTEKYADYLDICCAIAGVVPAVGVHLTENRYPQIVLDATELFVSQPKNPSSSSSSASSSTMPSNLELDWMETDLLFPTLGHLCGSLSDGKVPILIGLEHQTVSTDHLKAFCAAFGTTASSPLIHIAGITPEAKEPETVQQFTERCGKNMVKITKEQLLETYKTLNGKEIPSDTESVKIDLVALGNPHLSVTECEALADFIANDNVVPESNRKPQKHPDTRIMGCISRTVYSQVDPRHLTILRNFGMEFVFDTCWCMLLHKPVIPAKRNATIMTNSGKYAHYGPGLTQRNFRFGSMADCVRAARTGMFPIGSTRGICTVGMAFPKRSYSTSSRVHHQAAFSTAKWIISRCK